MTYGNSRDGIEEFAARVENEAIVPPFVIKDFAILTAEKLDHGDAKYGADAWARHDMLKEGVNEIVDLGNYAYLKWRQLREIECTPAVMAVMDAMVDLYAACLPIFANLMTLQNLADEGGIPRSLTAEGFVGVQAHEPGEPAVKPHLIS